MSRHAPKAVDQKLPRRTRIGVAAARFNEHIVTPLLEGCLQRLGELGLPAKQVQVHRVPGAFELPLAAKLLARSKKFDAIICLGCVIRGETPHFDYVAGECARGVMRVSLDEQLPVIFGVLTTNTEVQATDRVGGVHGHAGVSAANAAAEMILLSRAIKR
jgi:6,7-dimethyl-8-ribityllumazine synthase